MKNNHFLSSGLTLSLVLLVFVSVPAYGDFDFTQDTKAYKKKLSRRPGASLDERTHKLLTRAQEDLTAGAKERAFKALKKLVKRTASSPSEQAQVVQALAYAYAQDEENDLALKAFEQSLEMDALPQGPTLSMIHIISQMRMMKEQYKGAEQAARFWLAVAPNPSGQVYATLAGSLFEQKQKKEALRAIQRAIDLTSTPKESWLAMAVSLYFANNKYKEAAKVLKILVAQNPKKETYWKQWAASNLNASEDKKGLVNLELGHLMGTIQGDKQIKNATSLMMSTDLPYKAALWMETKLTKKEKGSLKVQKQLASAYMSSRENKKALTVLRNIHQSQPEVSTSIQFAQILLEEEKWKEAQAVFEKAKSLKPKKDEQERIYMGLGVAHFNMGELSLSRASFVAIADTSDAARNWLKFIQSQADQSEDEGFSEND